MPNRKRPHFVGLWLSDIGKADLGRLGERESLSKSDTLRLVLAYAIRRMPKGWRP